jgi:anti-sigma regulatory factor (Ser/Thr protein kinase)
MNPGELRIGGRGVFLMRALMDEVSCEPCIPGQRGNTLRLVKRRAQAG